MLRHGKMCCVIVAAELGDLGFFETDLRADLGRCVGQGDVGQMWGGLWGQMDVG